MLSCKFNKLLISVFLAILSANEITSVTVFAKENLRKLPIKTINQNNNLRAASFSDLPGWDKDDLREAMPAFLTSCLTLKYKSQWRKPCEVARAIGMRKEISVRNFFQSFFCNQVCTDYFYKFL